MMNPAIRPDANLAEYLAARARAASDGRLAVDVLAGAAAAIAVVAWRPVGWLCLIGLATCFTAFGAWGIADRELRERERSPRSLAARLLMSLRAVSVLVGGLAALLTMFAALALALGTWIS